MSSSADISGNRGGQHTVRVRIETMNRWAESRKALEAENARLRSALERVESHGAGYAVTIAREALGSERTSA